MDKYEYNLKLDQIKSLCAEENYESAAEIADTINWNKIKNVNALVKAGDIYEKLGRYEESREIFQMAYDRSPIGRTIIFRLAEVAIKMQDFESAVEYYNEFVDIAPNDNLRFIIQYDMKKAQGTPLKDLIPILEELKDLEYSEEWAYELAYLYHKAGQTDKCVEACDELILWFGDGPYVERALELKMLYQPLTKPQEEKYRKFRLERKGITSIGAEEMQRAGEYIHEDVEIPQVDVTPGKFNTVNLQKELAKNIQQILDAKEKDAVTDSMDSIKKIVEEYPFLQVGVGKEESDEPKTAEQEENKAIDDSLRTDFKELLEETEENNTGKKKEEEMVKKQITGQLTIEDVLGDWEKTRRAAEAALQKADQQKLESARAKALQEAGDIMERLNDVIPKLDAGFSPQDLLAEEYMQRKSEEDEISEEEMMKKISEGFASDEAEETPEEFVSDEAEETADAVSEEEAAETSEEFASDEAEEIPDTVSEEEEPEELPAIAIEDVKEDLPPIPAKKAKEEKRKPYSPSIAIEVLDDEPHGEEEDDEEDEEITEGISKIEPILIGDLSKEMLEDAITKISSRNNLVREEEPDLPEEYMYEPQMPDMAETSAEEEAEAVGAEEIMEQGEITEPETFTDAEEPEDFETGEESAASKEPEEPAYSDEVLDAAEMGKTRRFTSRRVEVEPEKISKSPYERMKTRPMTSIREFVQKKIEEEETSLPRVDLPDDLEEWKHEKDPTGQRKLTEEQKAVFTYFVPVSGMEHQLSLALEGLARHLQKKESAFTGNLIIQGGHGCGKTVLATSMIKALQKEIGKPGNKIGKIDAASLNKKDIQMLLKKVHGGCLIIENAGALNKQTAVALSLLLEHEDSGILVILEDTSKGIKHALALDDGFAKKFSEKISVPIFTNDDLVAFANAYSEELGYMIDDMAILALYNRISSIQKFDQATTLTEVKDIVDEAIDREAHGGLHKFFNILTAKRYSDDDRIILEEKDFE